MLLAVSRARGMCRRQPRGIFETHELIGTGIHDGVNDAQNMNLAIHHHAIDIDLLAVNQFFGNHPVRINIKIRDLLDDVIEWPHQPLDDVLFPWMEGHVSLQFGKTVYPPRQHRVSRLHGLDIKRELERNFRAGVP